eukprot:scaffold153348_cov28-Tisochrysis_lutea.AAC.6
MCVSTCVLWAEGKRMWLEAHAASGPLARHPPADVARHDGKLPKLHTDARAHGCPTRLPNALDNEPSTREPPAAPCGCCKSRGGAPSSARSSRPARAPSPDGREGAGR